MSVKVYCVYILFPLFKCFRMPVAPRRATGISASKFQISINAHRVPSQSITRLPIAARFCGHTVFSKA